MKKHIYYAAGAFALALAMSGLPAIALAENNGGGEVGVQTQVRVQTKGIEASSSARVGEGGQTEATSSKEQENQLEATSSNDQKGNENVQSGDQGNQEIDLELESTTTPAFSLAGLKLSIEQRKQELDQEVASTTEADKNIVENANPVRLAVHSLLASKDLLGGIGQQVSEIAKQMNDSVATTTNAEAKIQSRGFLTRFLFGGDSAAADVISQAVAQNQQRIDDLTKLLGGANVSVDIQIVLKAQITALQTAQTRLLDLAQKEQKMWGLFSWRF
jgi:hypothetical protein